MRTHSKTPLFLMELIIMLLVFSISAAVCLQVFTGAVNIADESRRLDNAVMQAQTAAECWKASHGDLNETAALLNAEISDDQLLVYYNEDGQPSADGEICLVMECEGMTADITVFAEDEEIIALSCEAVMQNG